MSWMGMAMDNRPGENRKKKNQNREKQTDPLGCVAIRRASFQTNNNGHHTHAKNSTPKISLLCEWIWSELG